MVAALMGAPSEKMDKAHEAKRLYQPETAEVERRKPFVAVEKKAELTAAVSGISREQQPDVLNRRSVHQIVEIDQEKSLARPVEDVATVTIAVEADGRSSLEKRRYPFDRTRTDG